MTEYGITWSGRKHIVGRRNKYRSIAACNGNTALHLKGVGDMPDWLLAKWDTAPICKRCTKLLDGTP